MAEMFEPIENELIIISDFNQVYWPGENLNTFISGWHSTFGAQIKLSSAASLPVEGRYITRQATLNQGWNYLPVLSECSVDVSTWLAPMQTIAKVVKDVAGTGVYWPEYNINTLEELHPGKAYYINWDMPLSMPVEFPQCEKGQKVSFSSPSQIPLSPWNEPAVNPGSHLVAFPFDVTNEILKTGDILGSFTTEGFCSGINIYEQKDFALVIFGNDPITGEKDGFIAGETMVFKIFRPSTNEMFQLMAEFKSGENKDKWAENGLSVLKSLEILTNGQENQHDGITIFPNPGNGSFDIRGLNSPATINIRSAGGEMVFNGLNFTEGKIDLHWCARGLYFVNILTSTQSLNYKLVIE